jgi:hypothetical protein
MKFVLIILKKSVCTSKKIQIYNHYKDQLINIVEIIAVYCENYAKLLNTFYGQFAELFFVKAVVHIRVVTYHWALKI